MKLEIDDGLVDKIVVEALRRQYESLCESIHDLEGRRSLAKYEEEDLKDNIMYARAIRKAVEYFSPVNDHERWLTSVEDEINER
jgi:hypothetical protein